MSDELTEFDPNDVMVDWLKAAEARDSGDNDEAAQLLYPSHLQPGFDMWMRCRLLLIMGAVVAGAAFRKQFATSTDEPLGFELLDYATGAPRVVKPEAAGADGLAAQLMMAGAADPDGSGGYQDVHALISARVRPDTDDKAPVGAVVVLLDLYLALRPVRGGEPS